MSYLKPGLFLWTRKLLPSNPGWLPDIFLWMSDRLRKLKLSPKTALRGFSISSHSNCIPPVAQTTHSGSSLMSLFNYTSILTIILHLLNLSESDSFSPHFPLVFWSNHYYHWLELSSGSQSLPASVYSLFRGQSNSFGTFIQIVHLPAQYSPCMASHLTHIKTESSYMVYKCYVIILQLVLNIPRHTCSSPLWLLYFLPGLVHSAPTLSPTLLPQGLRIL